MDEDLPEGGPKPGTNKPGDLSEYNLDNYDEDEGEAGLGPFTNIKGLTYYRNNEEDPYITLKDVSCDPTSRPLLILSFFDRITRTKMNGKSWKFCPLIIS